MISQDVIYPILLLLLFLSLCIYLIVRPYKKAKALIKEWANDKDYKIHRQERKTGLDTGPFIFGGWTAIYKVTIKDRGGNIKTFWTKTGRYLLPFSNAFIVKDDKQD
jgi:hypothetical protein